MIDGSLKSVLNEEKISKALIENSVEKLNGNKRLYIFSDHCDIRKPYLNKLENIGKVRDLNGNIINGFTALGSIILDENKIKDVTRVQEIAQMIEIKDESYQNINTVLYKHLEKQSKTLKKVNPELSICHVHDKGCDSVENI